MIQKDFFRNPFIVVLAGTRKKHISFEVHGKKAIRPGDGGDGGRGGFGGESGNAYLIGINQKPKTKIYDAKGLHFFWIIFNKNHVVFLNHLFYF